MTASDPAYKTQLLLLDLLSTWDDEHLTMSEPAFQLLVSELAEAGAITATMDDTAAEPEVDLDVTPLLAGAGALLSLVVGILSLRTELDRLTVISFVRDSVHQAHSAGPQ